MSYDLNVYLKNINNSCINTWIEELKGFGLKCEIHPDFSVDNQTGFLPFKVEVLREDIPCKSSVLLSGFEMDINAYEHGTLEGNDPFWKKIFKKKNKDESEWGKILKGCNNELTFYISSQDSLEFILAWYSAAILVNLLDGVLYDPQEGLYHSKSDIIKIANSFVSEYIKSIPPNDWNVHQFETWL